MFSVPQKEEGNRDLGEQLAVSAMQQKLISILNFCWETTYPFVKSEYLGPRVKKHYSYHQGKQNVAQGCKTKQNQEMQSFSREEYNI